MSQANVSINFLKTYSYAMLNLSHFEQAIVEDWL